MALNRNGQREVGQLTPDLQYIVVNHRTVFDVARTVVVQETQYHTSIKCFNFNVMETKIGTAK